MGLLASTGVGRDINRHYYQTGEVEAALQKPMVKKLLEMIRLRNTHPAFSGSFTAGSDAPHKLELNWEHGADRAHLSLDLAKASATIEFTGQQGQIQTIALG
jgi:sucrose phosphorylase